MKIYIGGLGHGQDVLAFKENGQKPVECDPVSALQVACIDKFHLLVKKVIKEGMNPVDFAKEIIVKNPDVIIVSDEVGSGIHPLERDELFWREQTGRALCVLAEYSESVTRVFCGIGQRIK